MLFCVSALTVAYVAQHEVFFNLLVVTSNSSSNSSIKVISQYLTSHIYAIAT